MTLDAKEHRVFKAAIGRELKKSSFVTDKTVFIVSIVGAGVALIGFSLHAQKERVDWLRREEVGFDLRTWKRISASPVEWHGFDMIAAEERGELGMVSDNGALPENPLDPGSVFEAISAIAPIAPPIIQPHPSLKSMRNQPKRVADDQSFKIPYCRVYVVGNAEHAGIDYVLQMQPDAHCEVHVFECAPRRPTMLVHKGHSPESPFLQAPAPRVAFHDWCIGQPHLHNFDQTDSLQRPTWQFKSLVDTMVELGHLHVDLLKLAMRGLEWQFFETEILPLNTPPLQLDFHLHTEGTMSDKIAQSRAKGKGFPQVNRLFSSFYRRGYYLISKRLDAEDSASGKFVLVRAH
jgi:hypothetical protein|mmetsp:Transcript_12083/g.19625  ORF Transcript_12083/g.19625 Transcript_12083/m.19625 type:complete len:348 (+) Transcript_12083:53-1096(+)